MTACDFNEVPNNIVQLREATKALQFSDIVRPEGKAEVKELVMEEGTSYIVGLYKTRRIAVARNYVSADCKFPMHSHDEKEVLIVYKGELHLTIGDEQKILKEGDLYYIEASVKHGGYTPGEAWFIAITIPANDAWPEGV